MLADDFSVGGRKGETAEIGKMDPLEIVFPAHSQTKKAAREDMKGLPMIRIRAFDTSIASRHLRSPL